MNFDGVRPITPGRGLKQGDPLSPYFLLFVVEGLSTLIYKAVGQGDLHGVRVCRGAPVVSHLLFRDDCFLFSRVNIVEAHKLFHIIHIYGSPSGQEINLSKS